MDDGLPPNYEEELARLIRQTLGDRAFSPFEPFAVYDQQLDRIWVFVRDCSTTEKWFDAMCIYEDNYREEGEELNVGFSIEHAGVLIRHIGLSWPVDLTRLLEAVESLYPSLTKQIAIARGLQRQLRTSAVALE